ncbi:MAG: copper resistance protein CopC [Nostocoides sp.]
MSQPRGAVRRMLRWAAGTLLALTVLVLAAAPASAHAQLLSTGPVSGSQIGRSPQVILLEFDEAVTLMRNSLRVLDAAGHDVTIGPVGHPGGHGEDVSAPLTTVLPRGDYRVLWRVMSDDGHPVSGTFAFGVGVPAGLPPPDPGSDPLPVVLHDVFQFGALAGCSVLLGAVFFLALIWPAGLALRPCRRLVTNTWWVGTVSTVGLFLLQGPYGEGLPLSTAADTSLIGTTLGSTPGRLLVLRLVPLLGSAGVWWAVRRRGFRPGRFDLAGLGLLLLESFSFAGHAGQGSMVLLWSTVDAAHLAAAGIWVGGLILLATVLWRRAGASADTDPAGLVVRRWSVVAASAVAVLVVTGVAQGLREVGGWAALAQTAYGRILLAKVAGLVLMLGVAFVTRRRVARGPRSPGRSVAVEAGLGVAVLALAAVLTSTVPARQAYQPSFSTTVGGSSPTGSESRVSVVVRPTTPGYEGMSVRVMSPTGAPVRLKDATGSFVNTAVGIGPLTVQMTVAPSGVVDDVLISVPSPGRWEVSLHLTATDGTTYAATLSYLVG